MDGQELILSHSLNNDKKQLPLGLLRIFRAGNDIHEKWQELAQLDGIATGVERRRYSKEYDLYLTPDLELKLFGKEYIGEIKSQNTFAFKKQTDHASARKQVNFYMHFTGVPLGLIIVEDKNNQEFKTYIHEYDPEMMRKPLERIIKIKNYRNYFIKNHKMVKRICDSTTCKRAQQCGMSNACWNNGDLGRVKIDG